MLWTISGSLSYLYGLPYAIDYLQTKAREQTYTQCVNQLRSQGLIGLNNSPLSATLGDEYCHCVADPLLFTREDLFDTARQKPPAHITQQAQELVETCNKNLDEKLGATNTPAATKPADKELQSDGTEVIHF